jgi:diguanylate cyclase (GGDEF)-like protein/PAS domain S-box-containing protein
MSDDVTPVLSITDADRVRRATFAIARAVAASKDIDDLFRRIHEIVGTLIPARNFYIAVHDSLRDELTFPYFVDEREAPPVHQAKGRGLTAYVLRTGKPLLAGPELFDELVASGEVELIGAQSIDWLGVPLLSGQRTIGVLVVQSYTGEVRYSAEDRDLLVFVASFIAQAIEWKRAENALRESENRHRAILQALPDLVFVIDERGAYRSVQAPVPGQLVASSETLLRSTVAEVMPPEQAALILAAIRRCLAERAIQTIEYELDVLAGRRVFEARLVPLEADTVVFLARDVTENRRVDRAHREAAKLLKTVTDNMVDVVTQTDLQGVIQFASPSHVAAAGWTPEELVGQPVFRWIHPGDVGKVKEFGRAVLANGSAWMEHRCLHRDGRVLWAESAGNVVPDDSGEPVGIVFGTRDVTDRKRRDLVLALLHEVDRKILRHEKRDDVLEFLCEELTRRLDFPLAWIGLKKPDGSVAPMAAGGPARRYVEEVSVRWDETPEGSGPMGRAIRSGRPVILESATAPAFTPWLGKAERYGLHSAISFPLIVDEAVTGALIVYGSRDGAFSENEVALLGRFADQIAFSTLEASQAETISLQTAALESAANAVVITDRNGRVEWINHAFSALTGYQGAEVIGKNLRFLNSGQHDRQFFEALWETILAGEVWRGEVYNRKKDGTLYAEEQTITPVRGAKGELTHFVAIKQDVTARKKSEERIEHLALHDPLTDLPNRRALAGSIDRMIARARRGSPVTLLLLDLDNFKVVNDTVGHASGDQLLVELAGMLARDLRTGDEIARLGGDEFVILLEGIPVEVGRLTAERLRRTVDEHRFEVAGRVFELGISIGVVPVDGLSDAAAVLSMADSALYSAKERGRNRVVVFDSGRWRRNASAEAGDWASRIKRGLREGRFVLHYQPIILVSTAQPVFHEALLRFRDEAGAVVLPAKFLGSAERFGLMPQIDRWVIDQALAKLASEPTGSIFVNLSGTSLGQENLLDEIEDRIQGCGLAPGRMSFEITETTAVRDIVAAREWMRRLNRLGCRFALDDFGTGFSSFTYLKSLPADFVKIDGSFIRDLEVNARNRALVKAIDTVAHTLGKETIAESVETLGTIPILRELGVEYAQGYALGRPAPESPEVPEATESAET